MKVILNTNEPERKLVALIGSTGASLYLRHPTEKAMSIHVDAFGTSITGTTLEYRLNQNNASLNRIAVYEGDTVTIQF